MTSWADLFRRAFESLVEQSASLLPRVFVTLLLLLLGVVVAFVLQAVVRTVLRRAGLDRLADQTGVGRFLRRVGNENPASHLAGFVVFWIILAVFLLSGADALGLPAVSNIIARFIALLPPVALAVFVVVMGLSAARTARRAIERVAEGSRMISARMLGAGAYYLVAALSVVIALSGLGIDFTIVTAVVVVVLASAGVGLAVMLGLGSRDVARNTISGIYARKAVRVGDRIRLGEVEGEVAAAGQVGLTLEGGGRTWLVPYDRVISSVVEIVGRGAQAGAP